MCKDYSGELAVIKEQLKQNTEEHKEVKAGIEKINDKLDVVIETKADKIELTRLNNRIWAVTISIITILIGMVAFLLKNKMI